MWPSFSSVTDVGVGIKIPELFELFIQGKSLSQHNRTPIRMLKKLIEMNEITGIIEVWLLGLLVTENNKLMRQRRKVEK